MFLTPFSEAQFDVGDEYKRLVDSGQLESVLVDPPLREHLVEAYVFGFFAVTIGIALAVAIFVGLLSGGH